jgi:hypothetical protein
MGLPGTTSLHGELFSLKHAGNGKKSVYSGPFIIINHMMLYANRIPNFTSGGGAKGRSDHETITS